MKNIKLYILSISLSVILPIRLALAATTIDNPIGVTSISELIASVLSKLYIFAIPIASLFILWGAFQIMSSGGSEEKISAGKKTILYAVGGLILMLFASGIGYVVQDILGGPTPSTNSQSLSSGSGNSNSNSSSSSQALGNYCQPAYIFHVADGNLGNSNWCEQRTYPPNPPACPVGDTYSNGMLKCIHAAIYRSR